MTEKSFEEILEELRINFSLILKESSIENEEDIINNLMMLINPPIADYRQVSFEIKRYIKKIDIIEKYNDFIFKLLIIKFYCDNFEKSGEENSYNTKLLSNIENMPKFQKSILLKLHGNNFEKEEEEEYYLLEAIKIWEFPRLLISLSFFAKSYEIKIDLLKKAKELLIKIDNDDEEDNLSQFEIFYHYDIVGDYMGKEEFDDLLNY